MEVLVPCPFSLLSCLGCCPVEIYAGTAAATLQSYGHPPPTQVKMAEWKDKEDSDSWGDLLATEPNWVR